MFHNLKKALPVLVNSLSKSANALLQPILHIMRNWKSTLGVTKDK